MTKKEEYELTKQMLREKFDGRCAFCGNKLDKIWHIWDIKPTKSFVNYKGEVILGDDSYENKLPACKPCNSTRVYNSHDNDEKIDIEKFRSVLYEDLEFLKTNTYYKKALRFHLIEETNYDIVFYFERKH